MPRCLSDQEIAAFCRQLSMVLQAGLSPGEGVAMMVEGSQHQSERALLEGIYSSLLDTGSLQAALAQSGAFPPYLLSMVHLGEEAGRLDEVMTALASYYETEALLRQSIHQAIAYPSVMVGMMLAVILLLITQVLPIFDQVFRQLGTQMTGFAGALLQGGIWMRAHWIALLVVLCLVAVVIWALWHRSRERSGLPWLPGGLSRQISAYQFANGMALTLRSGLTPVECLDLTAPLISQKAVRAQVEQCRAQVTGGEALSASISACGIFSGVYRRIVVISARTGSMDEAMGHIAAQYAQEITDRLSQVLSAIEPTLVILLSLLVGLILLSVVLPLLGLLSVL